MSEKYLNLIKHCFRELNIIYVQEIDRLYNLQAFNYEKEIKDFYKKGAQYFLALFPLVDDNEIKFKVFDEVEVNILNEGYFERMNLIFDRQFAFISKYEESIHLYFNDNESLNLIKELKDRFYYVKIPENLPALFLRGEDEIKEITDFLKNDYEIQEHLILEMIYDQDLLIFNELGSTPNDMDFVKISKSKFKHSIQLYYIHIFSKLEEVVKEALPKYKKKLNNIQYLNSDKTNYIQLKQEYNNPTFKLYLFEFLVKNDFIDCSLDDFESLFYPSEMVVNWKGTQKLLMLLLKGRYQSITDLSIDVSKSASFRFTCGHIQLKYRQLRVAHQHILKNKPVTIIDEFLSKIKN